MGSLSIRMLVLTALTAGLLGCMPPERQILGVPFDPAEKEALWQKAVFVLQSQGCPVTLVDQDSGIIGTDWYPSRVSVFLNDVRERTTITVSAVGTMMVNTALECRPAVSDRPEPWRVCAVEDAEKRQRQLAEQILGAPAVPELQSRP